MKITFVSPTPNFFGGIRVIAIYASSLQKRGHDVLIVSQPQKSRTFRGLVRSVITGKGLSNSQDSNLSYYDQIDVPHKVIDRRRPIDNQDLPDADVVIATWWQTAEWVAALMPSKGAKAYLVQGHEVYEHLPIERSAATYRLPLHKIAVSQWLVDTLKDQYCADSVSLVNNAVDLKQFYSPWRRQQPVPTVGFVYSRNPLKGCDLILDACCKAAIRIPNLRVLAFGPRKSELPPIVDYFPNPPQNQLRDIYSSCDAWIFGSLTEGFGLPILEAMACRTPVIGTPAGAAPELISKGGGILIASEDAVAMAAAIESICRCEEADWLAMSDAAYATAAGYTWDAATDRFEAALRTAINQQ